MSLSPRTSTCAECGQDYTAKREHSEFCSAACRSAFNNRRNTRGALIYDFFMAMRYERELAAKWAVWTQMCKLAAVWRREDAQLRAGRRSWGNWREWQRSNSAWLNAEVLVDGMQQRPSGTFVVAPGARRG